MARKVVRRKKLPNHVNGKKKVKIVRRQSSNRDTRSNTTAPATKPVQKPSYDDIHRYKPRGSCLDLFSRREPEVLISGPAGTGKSRACMEKVLRMCLLNGGMRALFVRKTRESLTSTVLVDWRENVAKEAIANGDCTYYGGSGEEPPQYRFTNGSVIVIAGMDKAGKVMSSQFDIIYIAEATELLENDWEHLTTRLRNNKVSFQQIIADCNPDIPTHWLNERCNRGQCFRLESRHEDNPVLFNDDRTMTDAGRVYIERLDNLTGVRKQRLRHGLWVAAEGIIYEGWNSNVHLIDRFDIPTSWTRYWTIDFGYTNPFVCQWWAEDPDGRLIRYREIYRSKRLVEDHAKDILNCVRTDGQWHEPKPRAIICDHDAEDRATLEKHLGLGTKAAKKSVSPGLQAVQSRMKIAGDGKPRIYFMRDSLVDRDQELAEAHKPCCTEEEIPGYIWKDSKTKEEPLKENDHGCDGTRYVVAELDLRGKGSFETHGWEY